MIPLNLVRPIIETTINAVIAVEAVFGRGSGKEKKVKALQDATKSAYAILDGALNLSDEVDKWAKDLIDRSVEKAVEYFNTERQGDFADHARDKAQQYVINSLELGGEPENA